MATADAFKGIGIGNGFPFELRTTDLTDSEAFIDGFTRSQAMDFYWNLHHMELSVSVFIEWEKFGSKSDTFEFTTSSSSSAQPNTRLDTPYDNQHQISSSVTATSGKTKIAINSRFGVAPLSGGDGKWINKSGVFSLNARPDDVSNIYNLFNLTFHDGSRSGQSSDLISIANGGLADHMSGRVGTVSAEFITGHTLDLGIHTNTSSTGPTINSYTVNYVKWEPVFWGYS